MKRWLLFWLLPLWISCSGQGVTPGGEHTFPSASGDPEPSENPSGEPSDEPSLDASAEPSPDPSTDPEVWPVLSGSFIQHWYPRQWLDSRWNKEMELLAEAGITYLIYTPMMENDSPAEYTSLERCLKSAAAHGVKILVGPNFHSGWWSIQGSDWLDAQMTTGVSVAREIYERFHADYPETLWGWYWDWEVDNLSWQVRRSALAQAWNITLDGLTAIDPDMPLLFSPFMNTALGTANGYGSFWKDMFSRLHLRPGDIFCPQDCVGARNLAPEAVDAWLAAMKEAADGVEGLRFWVNVEIFDMYTVGDNTWYATASLQRAVRQMEVASAYAEQLFCFAYSHYYSPQIVTEGYHKAYCTYRETGSLPALDRPRTVNAVTRSEGSGTTLGWTLVNKEGIEGVSLYKNDALLVRLQYRDSTFPTSFTDAAGTAADKYEIATYNCLGDESAKVPF